MQILYNKQGSHKYMWEVTHFPFTHYFLFSFPESHHYLSFFPVSFPSTRQPIFMCPIYLSTAFPHSLLLPASAWKTTVHSVSHCMGPSNMLGNLQGLVGVGLPAPQGLSGKGVSWRVLHHQTLST